MKRLFFLAVLLGVLVLAAAGCTTNPSDANSASGNQTESVSSAQGQPASSNQVQSITVEELKKQLAAGLDKNTVLVDLREPNLYQNGHIQGAILIPFADFEQQYTKLAQNKKIIFICHTGPMGEAAGQFLLTKGYTQVYNLEGGMAAWNEK